MRHVALVLVLITGSWFVAASPVWAGEWDHLFPTSDGRTVSEVWGHELEQIGDAKLKAAIAAALDHLRAGRRDAFFALLGESGAEFFPSESVKEWVYRTYYAPEGEYLQSVPPGAVRVRVTPWRDGWLHLDVSYRSPTAALKTRPRADAQENPGSGARVPRGTLNFAWRNGQLVRN